MALTSSVKRLINPTCWSRKSVIDQRNVLVSLCRGIFGKRESFKPHSKVLGHANNDIYEMQSECVHCPIT